MKILESKIIFIVIIVDGLWIGWGLGLLGVLILRIKVIGFIFGEFVKRLF